VTMSQPNPIRSEHQITGAPAPKLRPAVPVGLITTVALALSTLIAATAVSIGIARADIAGADLRLLAGSDSAPLALAWLIGLLLAGTCGLTALRIDARRRD
jgi:hypothetical protein